MAAWWIPALKAVLPHIGTIISTASPVFTKKKADAVPNQIELLQQQITELQGAASQNAAYIKELAEQLQSTVTAIEQATEIAEAKTTGRCCYAWPRPSADDRAMRGDAAGFLSLSP